MVSREIFRRCETRAGVSIYVSACVLLVCTQCRLFDERAQFGDVMFDVMPGGE